MALINTEAHTVYTEVISLNPDVYFAYKVKRLIISILVLLPTLISLFFITLFGTLTWFHTIALLLFSVSMSFVLYLHAHDWWLKPILRRYGYTGKNAFRIQVD